MRVSTFLFGIKVLTDFKRTLNERLYTYLFDFYITIIIIYNFLIKNNYFSFLVEFDYSKHTAHLKFSGI